MVLFQALESEHDITGTYALTGPHPVWRLRPSAVGDWLEEAAGSQCSRGNFQKGPRYVWPLKPLSLLICFVSKVAPARVQSCTLKLP